MEDLMYFSLIMLKRISPEDSMDPHVTRPASATATTSAQLKPSSVPPAQQEPDVVTDAPEAIPLEADPEPPVATETKKKNKSKKN